MGVRDGVGVREGVGVKVGVDVKLLMLPTTTQLPQPGKLNVKLTLQIPLQVELLNLAIQDTCVPDPSIGRAGGVDVVLIGEAMIFVADGL